MDGIAPDRPLDSAVLSRLKQFAAMNKLKKIALRVSSQRCSKLDNLIRYNSTGVQEEHRLFPLMNFINKKRSVSKLKFKLREVLTLLILSLSQIFLII